jgi:hypothetical protein
MLTTLPCLVACCYAASPPACLAGSACFAAQVAADAAQQRELQQVAANMTPSEPPASPVPLPPPPPPTDSAPATCNDIQPWIPFDQLWICETSLGWYPNQAAANFQNPSNEVCCLVGSCLLQVHCNAMHAQYAKLGGAAMQFEGLRCSNALSDTQSFCPPRVHT